MNLMDMPAGMPMEEEVEDSFTFSLPQNFTPPDNYEEGKPFDAVVSMVVSNGKMSLKSINGAKLAEEEAEDEESEDEEGEDEETAQNVESELEEDGGTTLGSQLDKMRYT